MSTTSARYSSACSPSSCTWRLQSVSYTRWPSSSWINIIRLEGVRMEDQPAMKPHLERDCAEGFPKISSIVSAQPSFWSFQMQKNSLSQRWMSHLHSHLHPDPSVGHPTTVAVGIQSTTNWGTESGSPPTMSSCICPVISSVHCLWIPSRSSVGWTRHVHPPAPVPTSHLTLLSRLSPQASDSWSSGWCSPNKPSDNINCQQS